MSIPFPTAIAALEHYARRRSGNPLTRRESGQALKLARGWADTARRYGHEKGDWRKDYYGGLASGMSDAVQLFGGSTRARGAGRRMASRAERAIGIRPARPNPIPMPNPIKVPFRNGQKIPVAKAWAWVQSTGDRDLVAQFKKAWELQKKANKDPKFVYWRTIPIGSSKKIDMVTAMAHYGNSPETYYTPPKGSKKGASTLYRHKWESGKRSVPLLAAASGKVLIMPLKGRQVAGDWLRG
jgi:hypothetical protein